MSNTAWQYYKNLKNNGVPEAQAEIEADALYGAIENLVTKDDLKTEVAKLATKDELKAEINNLETRLNARFDKIDARFGKIDLNHRWLMAIGIAILGALVAMFFK